MGEKGVGVIRHAALFGQPGQLGAVALRRGATVRRQCLTEPVVAVLRQVSKVQSVDLRVPHVWNSLRDDPIVVWKSGGQ